MVEQVMWCYLCFGQQGAELSSATDLQYDPDGLCVVVKQGRGGRSMQLNQRGHTEQNGPSYQSPRHTKYTYYMSLIIPLCLRAKEKTEFIK